MAISKIGTNLITDATIATADLADNSITSAKIVNGTIATADLADDAITAAKLAVNAVVTASIVAGSVDTTELAADAVTGAKIEDDAVDSEHYVDGSIDTAHISDNAVTIGKMADLARGKIIYGDSSGNPAVLAVGSNGQVLTSDGTDASWGTAASATTAGTVTTAAQTNITSLGTLTTLTVDDITIDSSTISDGSTLTVDAGGQIVLDADGGLIQFKDGGTEIAQLKNSSSDFQIISIVDDKDIIFRGSDAGTYFNALRLDMSLAGRAYFNAGASFQDNVNLADNDKLILGTHDDFEIYHDGSNSYIHDGGTGDLNIRSSTTLRLQNASGTNFLYGTNGGEVVLYHNGSPKLYTTSSGIQVSSTYSSSADAVLAKFQRDGGAVAAAVTYADATTDMEFGTTTSHALSLTTADTRRLTIESGGEVGIGTTSPGARLHVKSAGTGNVLYVESSDGHHLGGFYQESDTRAAFNVRDASGSVKINLDAGGDSWFTGGDVGIGTASPSDLVDITRTSTDQTVGLTLTNLQNGGYGSGIIFRSKRTDSGAIRDAAKIRVSGANSWNSDATTDSAIYFDVMENNSLSAGVMAIRETGKVGIGTTSPGEKLHVEGSMMLDAYNVGAEEGLFFREGFSSSNKYNLGIMTYAHNGSSNDGITIGSYNGFSVCTGSNSRQERFKISNTGAVSIPGTLGVTGNTTLGGLLTVNGANGLSLGSVGGDHRIDTAGSGSNVFRFLNSSDQITGIEITALKASTAEISGDVTAKKKVSDWHCQGTGSSTDFIQSKEAVFGSAYRSQNFRVSDAYGNGTYYAMWMLTSASGGFIDYKIIGNNITSITTDFQFGNWANATTSTIKVQASYDNGKTFVTKSTTTVGAGTTDDLTTWDPESDCDSVWDNDFNSGPIIIRFSSSGTSHGTLVGFRKLRIKVTADQWSFVPRGPYAVEGGYTGSTDQSITNTYTSLQNIEIPSEGKWLITSNYRIKRDSTANGFVACRLRYEDWNGSSYVTTYSDVRMVAERLQYTSSFLNLGGSVSWVIDVPYDQAVHIEWYSNATSGTHSMFNDSNGRPYPIAQYMGEYKYNNTSF